MWRVRQDLTCVSAAHVSNSEDYFWESVFLCYYIGPGAQDGQGSVVGRSPESPLLLPRSTHPLKTPAFIRHINQGQKVELEA